MGSVSKLVAFDRIPSDFAALRGNATGRAADLLYVQ
jgi:hypothetical protein